MNPGNEPDRKIRELFQIARQVDRKSAGEFRALTKRTEAPSRARSTAALDVMRSLRLWVAKAISITSRTPEATGQRGVTLRSASFRGRGPRAVRSWIAGTAAAAALALVTYGTVVTKNLVVTGGSSDEEIGIAALPPPPPMPPPPERTIGPVDHTIGVTAHVTGLNEGAESSIHDWEDGVAGAGHSFGEQPGATGVDENLAALGYAGQRPDSAPSLGFAVAKASAPGVHGVTGGVPGGVLGGISPGASGNMTVPGSTSIGSLPVLGGSYQNSYSIAPGVVGTASVHVPYAHGGRGRNFETTVDGVSYGDPLTGTLVANASPKGAAGKAADLEKLGPEANTEAYDPIQENDLLSVTHNPLSTFSIDVDTASYSNIRRFVDAGQLPPRGAVRIEELINYFPYDYPPPTPGEPFSVNVEIADCPWNAKHRLARIGLKAEEVSRHALRGGNFVFLIDVSGSMASPEKLPLVKAALALMVQELDDHDRIAIVVYAGASGLVLPPTSGADKATILAALEHLEAGGSTNGGEGLQLAYKTARDGFIGGGINRVILATDGDFNMGITDRGDLLSAIKKDADRGVFLTALGFGMGNLKDNMLETLADKGNGNYAYIDSLKEARKVLVEQMGGTLVTVAKDVKIQVEFNPAKVGAYRLVGYENRVMPKEHFNDDTKDAGEIGSGHSVTALYELVPPEAGTATPLVDPLKYQSPSALTSEASNGDAFTVKIRYKAPESGESRLLTYPITDAGLSLAGASGDFRFVASVALFGMILRESVHTGEGSLDLVAKLAAEGTGKDPGGYRAEFRGLETRAAALIAARASARTK